MVDLKNIVLKTPVETLERLLSPFIEEQFPSFMRRDYRKLVLFIKAYYEWTEQRGNPGFVLSRLDTIYDIDRSLDEFYSHFKATYLDGFPESFATNTSGNRPNKNTLLKHIRDFYGNKGTENAYKFLFRVLYDSDIEFYYPKEDILKTSDGRWVENISIKTTSTSGSVLFSAKGTTVYQYIGTALVASADVDNVVQYNQNGYEITEFFLKNLVGTFTNSNPVTFVINSQSYIENLYSVLSEFFIQTPGKNFRVGDEVLITDTKGTGFSAFIEQTGLGGTIKKIGVKNSGINYFNTVTVSFISETGDLSSAVVLASPTAVTRYPGFYINNSGKLSSTKRIQDGNYYQDFSYVLKTAVSLDTYFGVLKELVHPAGTRMFGSILVKDALDNTANTSTQGVIFRDPIIGNYTPYTSGTTLDLRNNGQTGGGGWCGAEGDLYPFGYNPYIGSTSEVGPSGKTAPLGTLFYGTSLGYTYCIVPEGGRTAHDPLGAPLGSTTSWLSGKETNLSPQGMRGLVLWLKPENIGVCGSAVNGASVDVWRDASPSGNDAMPPTWDKWNGVAHITHTATTASSWARQVYDNTNPGTKIAFVFNGLCGGFTQGRLCMVGLNTASNVTTAAYHPGNWVYSYGPHSSYPQDPRRVYYIQYTAPGSGSGSSETTPTLNGFDNDVFEMEYVEPNLIWRKNGVVKRTRYVGYGQTFYADSTFYFEAADASRTGTSVTITELSYNGNPVNPTFTVSSGMSAVKYAGVTVDKLRPTFQTASANGATGVSFNGGLVFSPQTTYRGVSLAAGISMGFTAAGSSAEKLLTGTHMYLKRPLKITDDADIFVVYRTTLEGLSYGYGLLASRNTNVAYGNNTRLDSVMFSRSYNAEDRNLSLQNSSYYTILPNGTVLYPGASLPPAGLVGFRPYGDATGVLQNFIAYDPHVAGVCMGICVGEARRDTNNKIESFLNGDIATNSSPVTGRRIVSVSAPPTDNFITTKNLIFNFDAGKTASLGEYVASKNINLLDAYPLTETPINVLAPQSPSMWSRDNGTNPNPPDTLIRVSQDGVAPLGTDEVYEFTAGANGNVYMFLAFIPGAWSNPSLIANTWTFTLCVRRNDGAPITSATVYMYGLGSNDQAAGTVEDIGNGWYRITRTKTGTTGTTLTLVGVGGLVSGTKYRIGRAMLLPYPSTSDISGVGRRESGNYPTGYAIVGNNTANEVGYRLGPWGKSQIVWEGVNHSPDNTIFDAFRYNGGFQTPIFSIDRTKLYRYSVWINRAVLGNGDVYFGNAGPILNRSNGATDTNPYFTYNGSGVGPYNGKQNKWVLVVGHIHPAGSAAGANHPNSGFYEVGSGLTYSGLAGGDYSDKIWTSTSTNDRMRVFLYNSNIVGSKVWFTQPRIEVVDGNEVSIEDLTNNTPNTLYDLSTTGTICEAFDSPQYSSDGGGSMVFNAKGGLITSKTGLALGESGNSTWEAWIKPAYDTFPGAKNNYMFMGAGNAPYFIAPSAGTKQIAWVPRIGNTRQAIYSPVNSISAGRWVHMIFVAEYDGTDTTVKMYINGVLGITAKYSGKQSYEGSPTNTPFFTIGDRKAALTAQDYPGIRSFGGEGFNWQYEGAVSAVRVYARALTEPEIKQNFNSLRNRFGV